MTKQKALNSAFDIGDVVFFDISEGLCSGRGTVVEISREEEDICFVYQLLPYAISSGNVASHLALESGKLYVNEFELRS